MSHAAVAAGGARGELILRFDRFYDLVDLGTPPDVEIVSYPTGEGAKSPETSPVEANSQGTAFAEAWRAFLGRVDTCAPGLARELYEVGQAVLTPSSFSSFSSPPSRSLSTPVLQVAWQGGEIVAAAGLRFGRPEDSPFTAELIGPAAVPQLRLPMAERLLDGGDPGGDQVGTDRDAPPWRQLAVRWVNLALITSLLRLAEEREVHGCVVRVAAGRDGAEEGAGGTGGGAANMLWERVATCLVAGFAVDPRCEIAPRQRRQLRERLGLRPEPEHPPRLGIVGRRGLALALGRRPEELDLAAFCDANPAVVEEVAQKYHFRPEQTFTSYEEMLEQADIDAVVLGTPMPLHVPQAVAALQAGKHVLSEVTAAVSLEQAWELLAAAAGAAPAPMVSTVPSSASVAVGGRGSAAASGEGAAVSLASVSARKELATFLRGRYTVEHPQYMMAENYLYLAPNLAVTELVRQGLFGVPYYGEGAYIHELRAFNPPGSWRRVWQTGRNGNTYPTHSVGPLLEWLGDQVETVSCLGSGHHYVDAAGQRFEGEDSTLTLCKLRRSDGLLQLRLDLLSSRPHQMAWYALQGTQGCYEAARSGAGEELQGRVWLAGVSKNSEEWLPLQQFAEFVPTRWRREHLPPEVAQGSGHEAADYRLMGDFLAVLAGELRPPVDVVKALEWTAVGLCSQQSIERGGVPVDLPDFRAAWRASRRWAGRRA